MNDGHNLPDLDLRDKRSRDAGLCDDDLRDRFTVLRREVEQGVPKFASLWRGRARVPLGMGRWLVAAGCALIVVVSILWLRSAQRKAEDVSVASITDWNSPTEFLLETPGRELLRTVPEIGEWRGYTPVTIHKTTPSEIKKKLLH
jgi:hypothetical protein